MKLLPPLFGGDWESFRDAVHMLNRDASFLSVIVNLLSNPLMNCGVANKMLIQVWGVKIALRVAHKEGEICYW
jgi:hypothetical protein